MTARPMSTNRHRKLYEQVRERVGSAADALADALDRTVPAVYADWLRLTNGLELFVTTLSEFDRLSEHFDEQGRERDPDRPTIPS
jgi:hypothetical protein